MTVATALLREGKQEGLQEGLQKGKLEGIQQGLEQGLEQGLQQGKLEGKLEGKLDTARNMLHKGMELSLIAELTDLPMATIRSLSQSNTPK